jgi:hypothetical protein
MDDNRNAKQMVSTIAQLMRDEPEGGFATIKSPVDGSIWDIGWGGKAITPLPDKPA